MAQALTHGVYVFAHRDGSAHADRCDFALVFSDGARFTRRLRHNLERLPLLRRDQCDYLGLFSPDSLARPWERAEPHLGYRLRRAEGDDPSKSRGTWDALACVLSARLIEALLQEWETHAGGPGERIAAVCEARRVPMWFTDPCWADYSPFVPSAGSFARAPDFDAAFSLVVASGFQPPEAIPGGLSRVEGEQLWRIAEGRRVLEMGTGFGQATVCLAQSADRVTTFDFPDQADSRCWAERYGVADRIEFVSRLDIHTALGASAARYDLAVVNSERDEVSVSRDLLAASGKLVLGGLLAVRDYPDPRWPAVRRVTDALARARGWRRVAQVDYLGVFQMPEVG